MSIKSEKELAVLVVQATWSIEEAAHLVHGVNPETASVVLSETSKDPVARTYFWLMKEYGKERLFAVSQATGEPRFSPGTLMRHLEEATHAVAPHVRRIYDAAHGNFGQSKHVPEPKEVYLAAAMLIWEDAPDLPKSVVAAKLVNLPSLIQARYLKRVSEETIRKWLRGQGPDQQGRPTKQQAEGRKDVDLETIAKKLPIN